MAERKVSFDKSFILKRNTHSLTPVINTLSIQVEVVARCTMPADTEQRRKI